MKRTLFVLIALTVAGVPAVIAQNKGTVKLKKTQSPNNSPTQAEKSACYEAEQRMWLVDYLHEDSPSQWNRRPVVSAATPENFKLLSFSPYDVEWRWNWVCSHYVTGAKAPNHGLPGADGQIEPDPAPTKRPVRIPTLEECRSAKPFFAAIDACQKIPELAGWATKARAWLTQAVGGLSPVGPGNPDSGTAQPAQ